VRVAFTGCIGIAPPSLRQGCGRGVAKLALLFPPEFFSTPGQSRGGDLDAGT